MAQVRLHFEQRKSILRWNLKFENISEVQRHWTQQYGKQLPIRLSIARLRDKFKTDETTIMDMHKEQLGLSRTSTSESSYVAMLYTFTRSSPKCTGNRRGKGKNVVQTRKKLTDVYGEGVLTVRQCQNWFAKFRSGNFDVEDPPRSGRSLLPDNTTINSEVYCHQLDKLNDALQQKRSELINRKGVVFQKYNARPHTSLVTRQKLLQLEWDTMPHPPYSPNLAPSDYYLFRGHSKMF
ncbi:uncharacterized protein TNCV_286781 [Trichonephila clavipes]|nr:uncharacterized protein TNCV_286781 [Trichonephila clavipes]